jgi:hypothetical protein
VFNYNSAGGAIIGTGHLCRQKFANADSVDFFGAPNDAKLFDDH